ncbi:MAG TPA: type I-E CRISPR-associated protein Cse1/CasA [Methylococcus sp.]|nr:type I-E CRISPR-associated protein Cse1/CasA [Methylococcus sp.]
MIDLLSEEVIGIRTPQGVTKVSLPALLARLATGEVEGYTGLRAHQADPWHVFLVQLAASILARHPRDPLPQEESFWHKGLLDLAEGKASAWHLVVEDVTQPAFLQHPLKSQEEIKTFKRKAATPDELDVLVTAKNHDVKMARMQPDTVEAWMFACLMYQTTSGYLGAGKYGILRMNSGAGSRAILAQIKSLHPSARFQEEVEVLCAMRDEVLQGSFGYKARGVVLTWLAPWDRAGHQYTLGDLEPWFIEACRPLRLTAQGGVLQALGTTSKARQIGPKAVENGDVGDPWTALNVTDKKKGRSALTVSSTGFTPELVANLLFQQGYELTRLQDVRDEQDGWFAGSVLVRGQGTTEGFHRIAVPVPGKAKGWLRRENKRKQLGKLASDLLGDAKEIQKSLRAALMALAEGGPEQVDYDRDAIKAWVQAALQDFARAWEDTFFPTLWHATDEEPDAIQRIWRERLAAHAQTILRTSEERLPLPTARRYRALVNAEGALIGGLIKKGLFAKATQEEMS